MKVITRKKSYKMSKKVEKVYKSPKTRKREKYVEGIRTKSEKVKTLKISRLSLRYRKVRTLCKLFKYLLILDLRNCI